MRNNRLDNYALRTLGLVIFGMAGVILLIYVIAIAFAQKNIFGYIIWGSLAILISPAVNTITGIFDGSVKTTPGDLFSNYWRMLISLIFALLFILAMFPFIALYLGAVLGAMGLVVCIVFFFIYFIQNVIGIDIHAAKDIGQQLGTTSLVFLGLIVYEALFATGYYFCKKI